MSGQIDYSQERGVSDEQNWIKFVLELGGELATPLVKRSGIKSADFLFRKEKVVLELKTLETELLDQPQILQQISDIAVKYPVIEFFSIPPLIRSQILQLAQRPLRKRIAKANKQIKETIAELGLKDYRGVIIIVNDNFKSLPPGYIIGLIGIIMSGSSFKTTKCVLYMTNHYVEIPDNPYACLLWAPQYSVDADDELVNFINELGRSWRKYVEKVAGPFDFSGEQEKLPIEGLSVVRGINRNQKFVEPQQYVPKKPRHAFGFFLKKSISMVRKFLDI
jgi:hypothetical protein